MIRAGEGIVINYDGAGAEIATSAAQWFVAEITGRTTLNSGSTCPIGYSWRQLALNQDGCNYGVANPGIKGDEKINTAYALGLPGAIITNGTQVIMRIRSGGASSEFGPTFEFVAGGSGTAGSGNSSGNTGSGNSSGSGSSCFDVIQSIDCTDGELSVTYATICPDSGTAIIVGQQTGNYSITTRYSITGGATLAAGVTLNLVGDVASPGNSKVYGTNDSGVRGWQDLPNTLIGLIGFPAAYIAGYLVRVNAAGDGLEFYVNPYALQVDLETAQTDITTLQGDLADLVSAVESIPGPPDLSSIYSRLTALETDLATVQGDITTLQGDITTLQGDLATANGNISTLQSDLAALSGVVAAIPGPPDLSSIYSRLSALESA